MDVFTRTQLAALNTAYASGGPTPAQAEAGNYRKGRVTIHGLPIAIECPRGSYRCGMDADGKEWRSFQPNSYGHFEKVKGADGDGLDVFIGPMPESERLWVINQVSPKTGAFDEHKVMLGFASEEAARAAYLGAYEAKWQGLGSIVPCSIEQFKWWMKYGNVMAPLDPKHLPFDGEQPMNEAIVWDSAANPIGTDLAGLIYQIRREDTDSLMLDAVTVADILADSDGELALDALVIPYNQLERKMTLMQAVMNSAGNSVKPVAMQVTPPFKQRGTTNVAAIFELSDGQTVSIFFHNPDTTPNKITPGDEMVSWKWLLNRKDVTILVAPERGADLNVREVSRRVMRLAEKNSARFQAANAKKAERMAGIESLKQSVEAKEAELGQLQEEITDLTAKVEAKRAASPASLQSQNTGVAATQDDKPATVQGGTPDRIDYDGQGAGTPIKGDDAFNRRYRHMQRQIAAAGGSQTGSDGYEIKMEDEGRVLYAIKRSAQPDTERSAPSKDEITAAIKDGIRWANSSQGQYGTEWMMANLPSWLASKLGISVGAATAELEKYFAGDAAQEESQSLPKDFRELARAAVPAEFVERDAPDATGFLGVAEDGLGVRVFDQFMARGRHQVVGRVWEEAGQDAVHVETVKGSLADAINVTVQKVLAAIEAKRKQPGGKLNAIDVSDFDPLRALGQVTIYSLGSENVYMRKGGKHYVTKLLEPDDYTVGQVVDLSSWKHASESAEPANPRGLSDAQMVVLLTAAGFKSAFRLENAMRYTGISESQYKAAADELNADGRYLKRSAITDAGRDLAASFMPEVKFTDGKLRAFKGKFDGAAVEPSSEALRATIFGVSAILKSMGWVDRGGMTWDRGGHHVAADKGEMIVSAYNEGELVEIGRVSLASGDDGGIAHQIEKLVETERDRAADDLARAEQDAEQAAYSPFNRASVKMPTAVGLMLNQKGYPILVNYKGQDGWTNGHMMALHKPKVLTDAIAKYHVDEQNLRKLGEDSVARVIPRDATVQVQPVAQYDSHNETLSALAAMRGDTKNFVKRTKVNAVILTNEQEGVATAVDAKYFGYFDKQFKQPGYFVAKDGTGAVVVKKAGEVVGVMMPMNMKEPNLLKRAAKAAGQGTSGMPDKKAPEVVEEGFRHAGFRIYPTFGRYAVQSIDNLQREQRGERQVGGDTLVESQEAAKAQAELQVEQMQDMAEREAKRVASEKASADALAARNAMFADFVAYKGYSAPSAEKAIRVLLDLVSVNGKPMTRKELIESDIAEGRRVTTEDGQRGLEHPDGRFRTEKQLTKTGIDYAEFLLSKRPVGNDFVAWEEAFYTALEEQGEMSRSDAQGVAAAQGDMMDQQFVAGVSPEAAAAAVLVAGTVESAQAATEDTALTEAKALLQSVIDGSADMFDPELADKLTKVHDDFTDDSTVMDLFEKAAQAYSDFMVAEAKKALA